MDAINLLRAGKFQEAAKAFQRELRSAPNDIAWVDGLSKAYQKTGMFKEAIPLLERVHVYEKSQTPDHPGQHLDLAAAYWCLEERERATEYARGLCVGILDRSVNMAPDHAGGATFGLILHYMALTAGDEANRDYALKFLRKLNVKYDKRPKFFRYPAATVKQLLGEVSLEDAVETFAGMRDLGAVHRAAKDNRSFMLRLGIALFHDGVISRVNGDEAGCKRRMNEVFNLGYTTDSICWYLARHEVVH